MILYVYIYPVATIGKGIFQWIESLCCHCSEASVPQIQWCISPCFRCFPISESTQNFRLWPFSTKSLCFIHWLQIRNFPLSAEFIQFPYFEKLSGFPTIFFTFPSSFVPFMCFCAYLRVFCFPLFLPWCIYASFYTHSLQPTERPCHC